MASCHDDLQFSVLDMTIRFVDIGLRIEKSITVVFIQGLRTVLLPTDGVARQLFLDRY